MEPQTQTATAQGKRRRGRKSSTTSTNDTTCQQQSSTSPPTFADSNSEQLPNGEYDVFLNFRGPDTRQYFTDVLYRFLVHLRIRTFRDEEELRKGGNIWSNLVKAIRQSKIYIPVFSRGYAWSKYCLMELVEMTEHRKREKGHIIFPIYYLVDPGDVRNQTGPYEKAFDEHKRKKKTDEKTIQSWRAAMNEVGNEKGWHIKSRSEAAATADIVSATVWSHINKNNYALETDELVGIDNQVDKVVDRLNLASQGVDIVGLYGLGGIGKTTIATAVYNKIALSFDHCSFVRDIRDAQQQTEEVLGLQKKFISNILGEDSVRSVHEVSHAKKIIKDRVSQSKIFVILDDVDEKFNFKDVLGDPKIFKAGSRFIVTSRNINVLTRTIENDNKLYAVKGLDDDSSLKLFCKHAFRKDSAEAGFEQISKKIVSTTGNLPLTLKTVGSGLYRAKEAVWNEKLAVWNEKFEQLQLHPEKLVMDRLEISFTDIGRDIGHQPQQIFLDIACFLIGKSKETASYMWRDCNFFPASNINVLVQRCMLKIGDHNEFQMHDQLRDMGREIVRRENTKSWKRSRIWSGEEAIELLGNNQCKNVTGIRVNSGSDDVPELDSACFKKLSELRYFDAGTTRLNGDFSNRLPNLKWMQLQNHNGIPNFNMRKMVIFDVNVEGLGNDCIKTKEATRLKVLNLPHCREMSKLPEFPESGSLEMLRIDYFKNREEDMDIDKLRNLKVFKLVSCELGNIEGGTIGMMKELRELNLYDINCNFDSFKRAIADIEDLSSLEILNVKSHYLVDVLEGIKLPKSLKYLITQSGFANIEELMELEEFIIIGSSMKTTELVIPPALDISWINSSKLKSMKLYSMKRIRMVDSKATMLPSSLTTLHIHNLDSEQLPNLKNLGSLTELEVKDCPNVREVQGVGGMKSLQILRIYNAGKLTCIYGLGNLMSSSSCRLTNLEINECPLLDEVLTFEKQDVDDAGDANANGGGGGESDLVRIESLLDIEIHGCRSLDGRSLPRLSKFPKIKVLRIEEIHVNIKNKAASQEYQLLEGLENLEELVSLTVHHLPKVQRLPSLSKLIKLSYLSLRDLPSLLEIVGLGELKSLKQLKVSGCVWLERLPVADLPLSTMYRIELDLRASTNFVKSDVFPLTTARTGDYGKLEFNILFPEAEEAIQRNILSWPQSF